LDRIRELKEKKNKLSKTQVPIVEDTSNLNITAEQSKVDDNQTITTNEISENSAVTEAINEDKTEISNQETEIENNEQKEN
jgi:hypothetical protein